MPGKCWRGKESKFHFGPWLHQITHVAELLTRSQMDKPKLAIFFLFSSLFMRELLMSSGAQQAGERKEELW